MAIVVSKKSIDRNIQKKIIDDLTIIETISYIQKIKNVVPKRIKMFMVTDEYVHLPYYYALQNGYQHSSSNWLSFDKTNKHFIGNLRENQIEYIEKATQKLNETKCVIISTPPGSGKTIMAAKIWHDIGLLGIIIVNRITILNAWVKTFQNFCPNCNICIVDKNMKLTVIPDILISMDQRIKYIPDILRKKIGTVIFDEAHLLCSDTRVSVFLAFEPKYVIMETATLERNDGFDKMIKLVAGSEGVFEISKVPYNFILVKTGIIEKEEEGEDSTYQKLCTKLCENDKRQEIVIDIVKANITEKIIILSDYISGIDKLMEKLIKEGIPVSTLYGNQNKYQNARVLIGTMPKIGTGFDEENVCSNFEDDPMKSSMLIMLTTTPQYQRFEQARGRVMRCNKTPTIIWLIDETKVQMRHFREIKSWIQKTNGTIYETESGGAIKKIN